MAGRACRSRVTLSGHWNTSGVVLQIKSLPSLLQMESGLEKFIIIDCSKISSVDFYGLQLLHAWLQCLNLRGVKPELINLPANMQQAIKQTGLEKCFSVFMWTSHDNAVSGFNHSEPNGQLS